MSDLVRRPPLEPSSASLAQVERTYGLSVPVLKQVLRWWQQLEVVGREHVPVEGPALVLANHVTFFDPFTLMVAAGRPIHFMAGEGMFDDAVLGRLARWSGAVPRKKQVADPLSIRRLVKWSKVGGLTGIFPEGERTWDGHPGPFVPGIARLAGAMSAPVVPARLEGGYHQHPRWAARQRRGPVRVVFGPPRSFSRRDDPAEIRAWLRDFLRVDPAERPPGKLRGSSLAEGLPDALYQCPTCAAVDSLRAGGDLLTCTECTARWTLDLEHRLHAEGGGPVRSVSGLLAELRTQAATAWRDADPDAPLLQAERAQLLDITDAASAEVGRGRLVLTPTHLALPEAGFEIPLADLRTINVYLTRRLQIRSASRSWEVVLPDHHSALRWQWVGEPARRAQVGDT